MIWRSNERVILTFDEVAVESVFSGVIECQPCEANIRRFRMLRVRDDAVSLANVDEVLEVRLWATPGDYTRSFATMLNFKDYEVKDLCFARTINVAARLFI